MIVNVQGEWSRQRVASLRDFITINKKYLWFITIRLILVYSVSSDSVKTSDFHCRPVVMETNSIVQSSWQRRYRATSPLSPYISISLSPNQFVSFVLVSYQLFSLCAFALFHFVSCCFASFSTLLCIL